MKKRMLFAVLVLLTVVLTSQVALANLSGAIFTTNPDGSWVNGNTKYAAKEDVYLDGGPGQNAPVGAAGLPAGDYYFQVTDPSGKIRLSMDPIASRKVRINAAGVIDMVYPAATLTKYQGKWYGTHLTGMDVDHNDDGAITVQLMPYDNTPNNGGVYKVWMTPVSKYSPGQGKWGFIPSESKTDNFKVKSKIVPPSIKVKKFHDLNANGIWDSNEPAMAWWVDIAEPSGALGGDWTEFTHLAADAGTYSFTECMPECDPGWKQTALYIDGVAQPLSTTALVQVLGNAGETHEVVFGNVQQACVEAEKFYDKNGDGDRDPGEVPVPGIKFVLCRVEADGSMTELDTMFADADGKCAWHNLDMGTYAVEEISPGPQWVATTDVLQQDVAHEGDVCTFTFGNYFTGTVGFFTKGFWHNKNGMALLDSADRDFVNALDPYDSPSSYFEAGDEGFDGLFSDGSPVAAAFNNTDGTEIWAAGSWQAEVSQFLVDNNGNGDKCEQLAQQLLAFIFNMRHQAPGATLMGPSGELYPGDQLIDDAIACWASGTDAERTEMEGLLDWFNNHHIDEGNGLSIIYGQPGPVVY